MDWWAIKIIIYHVTKNEYAGPKQQFLHSSRTNGVTHMRATDYIKKGLCRGDQDLSINIKKISSKPILRGQENLDGAYFDQNSRFIFPTHLKAWKWVETSILLFLLGVCNVNGHKGRIINSLNGGDARRSFFVVYLHHTYQNT